MSANPFRASAVRRNGPPSAPWPAISSSPTRNLRSWKPSPDSARALDENTRQIIEHGRRIRSCLKQPESQPLSVAEQIALLLALTAKLFDPVPLAKMKEGPAGCARGGGELPGGVVRPLRDRGEIE